MDSSGVPNQSGKRLCLVDGHSYAYRAFYAIRQLSSPTGRPTNAIYGFIRMLNKLRATLKPTHIAVIWDGGLDANRMALLPAYKAHRPQMPDALESQIAEIIRFLELAGVASILRDGVEADDLIATLTKQAVSGQFSVVIASSDKDFMQLVSNRVGLLNPNDKSEKIWSPTDVQAKTGVQPNQIIDWLSLIGDTVDNIAGVPGVGPLRAAQLLQQFTSIDNIYRNVVKISSQRVRIALQTAEDDVRRNQRLICLHDELPYSFDWHEFAPKEPRTDELLEFYGDCGFKTLTRELQEAEDKQRDLL